MRKKIQGKAAFAELQDSDGRIQVYFNRDVICPSEDKSAYNELFKKLLDLGDFIGIEGELFNTQVGEKTVLVKNFKLRGLPTSILIDKNGKEFGRVIGEIDFASDFFIRLMKKYI